LISDPSAIFLAVGTAEPSLRLTPLDSASVRRGWQFAAALLPHCKSAFRNFILLEHFQIELPLNENAIILARKVDISPVGVRPGTKNGLPP
jgi:hypothetical protein